MDGKTTKKVLSWSIVLMIGFLGVLNLQMVGLTRNISTLNNAITGQVIDVPNQGRGTVELAGFTGCLVNSDAIFYGTEWCGFCTQQKQVLGETFTQYSEYFYVDCDEESERCANAGVTAYPTWIINGQSYQGVQSIDVLSRAIGC